ncbi:MAG: PEP-CTERM sorting domain-containing protein, partial [Pseudomonadota bacterium]
DAPVSQSGGTVFSFSGTTTVRIGNVTFAQSEDRALETSSVNGFGFPFSGEINLDGFSASPDLSSFETVEAGFTFTTTGTIASASTLPGRSDIETYDSGLLGFFAKEDQVRGQLFQALGVIDRVSIDGEAFAFEGDLSADFGAAAVPLPDSMQLMLLGLGGLFFARREVTA